MTANRHDINAWLDAGRPVVVIDVRSPYELNTLTMGGLNIPAARVRHRIAELEPYRALGAVFVCACSHNRSTRAPHAAEVLRRAGFEAYALEAGIYTAWSKWEGKRQVPLPDGATRKLIAK